MCPPAPKSVQNRNPGGERKNTAWKRSMFPESPALPYPFVLQLQVCEVKSRLYSVPGLASVIFLLSEMKNVGLGPLQPT